MNLEKARKMERRDKNIFGHPQTSNTSMVLGSGFGDPKGPGSRLICRALSNKHFYEAKTVF